MNDKTEQRIKHRTSASERRIIGFLVAKVAIFVLLPLLASAVAVYVMLYR